MSARSVFSIILIIVVIGFLGYWFFTRPTPQETVVRDFINQVRRGNVDAAADYLIDSSFGTFIADSVIIDSGGKNLKDLWGNDVNNIEGMARSYIPCARGHVPSFEVESMETHIGKSEPGRAFVVFEFNLKIKEAFDIPGFPCEVYGTAELCNIDGQWLIKRFEGDIELHDRSIEKYIDYYNL
ncbi:hypothetical protein J7L05_10665 [bacterium]|nr:hypothetical protein [bacterium]